MRCPWCAQDDDRVVDSRAADGGAAVRRRRACRRCGRRFSTVERVEAVGLSVRKRDGVREPFDVAKVRAGIEQATAKLPVEAEAVDDAVRRVEVALRGRRLPEVRSEDVAAEVLDALRTLDPVAYVRFASVYKGFTSPEDFRRELTALRKDRPPKQRSRDAPQGPQR